MSWVSYYGDAYRNYNFNDYNNSSYYQSTNRSCGNGEYFRPYVTVPENNINTVHPYGSELCDSGRATRVPKNYRPNANLNNVISRFRSYGFQPTVLLYAIKNLIFIR